MLYDKILRAKLSERTLYLAIRKDIFIAYLVKKLDRFYCQITP
ncbi:hypothetical protein [Crocosphaera chwakensis]